MCNGCTPETSSLTHIDSQLVLLIENLCLEVSAYLEFVVSFSVYLERNFLEVESCLEQYSCLLNSQIWISQQNCPKVWQATLQTRRPASVAQ